MRRQLLIKCREMQWIPLHQTKIDQLYKMQTKAGGFPTDPLQLSFLFLWAQSGWKIHMSRFAAQKDNKRDRKNNHFIYGSSNCLLKVNHVKIRKRSLQHETTKWDWLKFISLKTQLASYLYKVVCFLLFVFNKE